MKKSAVASEISRIISFLAVGGGGFFVHAGVLWLLTYLGLNSLLAWFPAFLAAVLFTWLLNRLGAFRGLGDKPVRREAAGYFIIQSLGAGINFVVYAAIIGTRIGVTTGFFNFPELTSAALELSASARCSGVAKIAVSYGSPRSQN